MYKVFNLLFVATLFFWVSCSSGTAPKIEQRVEYYENGSVSRTVSLQNGKKEGVMTDYYPNGKCMAERIFVNGNQEGKTVIYYPTGVTKEIQYYNQGQQQGGDTMWYEDGKIQFTVWFDQNKKNGYLRKWSPDGSIVFESKYAMDTLLEVKGQPIPKQRIQERSLTDPLIQAKGY